MLHNCPENGKCINERGGFNCKCNPGFSEVGGICDGKFDHKTVLIIIIVMVCPIGSSVKRPENSHGTKNLFNQSSLVFGL